MKKRMMILALLLLILLSTGTALAESYRWRNHAAPFDFLFGNHIDSHQQSKVINKGKLQGFFYIRFTGEFTEDGYPIAEHANCNEAPDECLAGWVWHGLPVEAKYLGHLHDGHPTWCVDPADLPSQPGYSHFHWLDASDHADGLVIGETYPGYLLKLTARETFFFHHHGGFLVTPGIDTETHQNVVTDCD